MIRRLCRWIRHCPDAAGLVKTITDLTVSLHIVDRRFRKMSSVPAVAVSLYLHSADNLWVRVEFREQSICRSLGMTLLVMLITKSTSFVLGGGLVNDRKPIPALPRQCN